MKSLTDSSYVKISSPKLHSQTIRARELKFWEKVHHPPLHVMCQVSHVTCHISGVTCHMSCVTCHMSQFFFLFYLFIYLFFGQSGEASRWRVCYQRGLPRLVFSNMDLCARMTKSTLAKGQNYLHAGFYLVSCILCLFIRLVRDAE